MNNETASYCIFGFNESVVHEKWDCAPIVPVKVKYFQTKPKVRLKSVIESISCNYTVFQFSESWSSDP